MRKWVNKLHVSSLRDKILLTLFFFILLPYTYIFFNYRSYSEKIIEEKLIASNQELVSQKAAAISDLTTRMLRASTLLVNDSEVMQYLTSDVDWSRRYEASRRLTQLQKKLQSTRDILVDDHAFMALIDFRGYVHSTWFSPDITADFAQFAGAGWYQRTIALNGRPNWELSYRTWIHDGDANRIRDLTVVTRVVMGDRTSGGYGIVFIGVPTDSLLGTLAQSDLSMKTFIIDEQGGLLAGSSEISPQELQALQGGLSAMSGNKLTLGGDTFLLNAAELPEFKWKVLQLMPQQEFNAQLQGATDRSFSWMLIWFIAFTLIFVYFMFRITEPIRLLAHSMKRLGAGDFETKVEVKGRDEISLLGVYFNKMTAQLKQSLDLAAEEQRQREEARFQALQAQIHPHFLFNTLNSIKWRAMLSGDEHVSHMITTLGRLLEFSMRHDRELISVAEELEYLEMYMNIQKMRYHDHVMLHIDVPERIRTYAILKFTLQPIVENSIIHGRRQQLHIRIAAEEQAGRVILRVTDNGMGMPPEKLKQVQESMEQPHAKFSGVGLHNVHERIQRFFGRQFGIEVGGGIGQGLEVAIHIPLQSEVSVR